MPKILAVILGIAAGALGGALVFLLIAFSLYDDRRSPWEWTILSLILFGTMAAALFGGAMGAVAGLKAAKQEMRRAAITFARGMGAVAVLTLLGAAGLWAVMRMPRSDPAERQKKQWARAMGPLDPTIGLQLAHSLLNCHASSRSLTPDALGRNGCSREQSFLIGATTASFDRHDNGWRWESVKTPRGYKVVVRPDPLLEQSGPIFEFDDERLLVRRERPGAPNFAVDTPIPAVEAYRECLLASGSDGCAHLEKERVRVQAGTSGSAESHRIRLLSPDTAHLLITLFPRGRNKNGPFELHITGRGRAYMFQEGGGWHVTNNRNSGIAIATNPPPPACELNPAVPCPAEQEPNNNADMFKRLATRVRFALRAETSERVIVRFDPNTMPGLVRTVEQLLPAQRVELVPYGPVENFEARLENVTAYVWLPTSIRTPAEQTAALARWTDRGGRRREVHVHWAEGTLDFDGRTTTHPPGMDERYLAAVEVSPTELMNRMHRMISALTSGEVRVSTPAGTDVRFRVGARPFNRQTGSAPRVDEMRIRIDRHTEIPAGVLRVAPLETTVNGVMAFPSFWIRENVRATGVRLEFKEGRIIGAAAIERLAELENYLRSQPALMHFREFCVGLNPNLRPDDKVIPYYGYGAGVVRMSLGDNEELGGTVRGGAVRWNFFVDATVKVGERVVVKDGRLTLD